LVAFCPDCFGHGDLKRPPKFIACQIPAGWWYTLW
jgi:hypothetical protein